MACSQKNDSSHLLSFNLVSEYVIREVSTQSICTDFTIQKSLHTKIEAAVEVRVALVDGLHPVFVSLISLAVEVGNAGLLVEHVCTLAYEGNFHAVVFVEVFLEILNK